MASFKQFNEIKKHGISNTTIEEYFQKHLNITPNIVYLSKMDNINTLDDVFKGQNYAVIHVATTSLYDGHWQLLIRKDKNNVLFFDSYGYPFTKILGDVFRVYGYGAHNQSWKLAEIIQDNITNKGLKTQINTHKYQSDAYGVSTCGYHVLACYVVFEGLRLEKQDFNFGKYKKIMDNYRDCNKLKSYDNSVIEIFAVKP